MRSTLRHRSLCKQSPHLAGHDHPFSVLFLILPCLLVLQALLFLVPDRVLGEVHNVGFQALVSSLPEQELRQDINIWYPTESRRRRTISLQSWTFRAANRAPVAPGRFPLILLSHPSAGSRFTLHNTASWLAARGYIVAALTHPRDNLDYMPAPYTWQMLMQRCQDIERVLDLLLGHEVFAQAIDEQRIGMAGFGAGGTCALLLGGALADCSLWTDFCKDAKGDEAQLNRDPYCNPWAVNRIGKDMCSQLPQKTSLADTRIKAVAAVNPSFTMLFSHEGLRYLYPSVLLVHSAGKRTERLEKEELQAFGQRFSFPPLQAVIEDADTGAFMAPCPEDLLNELPELCYSVDPKMRRQVHGRLMAALGDFFNRTLVQKLPRSLPEPPTFELMGPPRPEDGETGNRRSRR